MIRFGFITFLSCFSREVVVGGVYSFFLQRAVSPCSNGMLSDMMLNLKKIMKRLCLNPCSNGMLSDYQMHGMKLLMYGLILVLMEYSLTPFISTLKEVDIVLILVLMECSLTYDSNVMCRYLLVLILVLMEYSLTGFDGSIKRQECES